MCKVLLPFNSRKSNKGQASEGHLDFCLSQAITYKAAELGVPLGELKY